MLLSAREKEWLENPDAFLKAHGRNYHDVLKHRVVRKMAAATEELTFLARHGGNLGFVGLSFKMTLALAAVEAHGFRVRLGADGAMAAFITGWTGFLDHLVREGVVQPGGGE